MNRICRSTNIKSALRSRQQGFLLNPFRMSVPPSSDPYFANVHLLLHGDGVDEATATVDSSSFAKSITSVGGAKLDSAQSKWGGTSMYFSGSSQRYTAPASTSWEFGTGDFSLEAWIRPSSVSDRVIFNMGWAGNNMLLVYITTTGKLGLYIGHANSGWVAPNSTAGVVANVWQFLSVQRSGTAVSGALDGTTIVSATSGVSISGSVANGAVMCIGGAPWGYPYVGWIDDARITKGVARGHTVPTEAFPNS